MGKPEGTTNRGLTRAMLLDLIRNSGLDLSSLCRMEGESIAQPTKPFLERIVERYGLASSTPLPIVKRTPGFPSTGVKKFFTATGETSNNGAACPEITRIANISDAEDNIANTNEDPDDNVHFQPNQEANQDDIQEVMETPNDDMQLPLKDAPDWYEDLVQIGYGKTHIWPPNKAVQLMLGCIMNTNVHKYIMKKEAGLEGNDISVVTFLGMNNMFDMVSRINKLDNDLVACMKIIDEMYEILPLSHFEAENNEIMDLLAFLKGAAAVQEVNGVSVLYPPMKKRKSIPAPKNKEVQSFDMTNYLFDINKLSEKEQRDVLELDPINEVEAEAQVANSELDNYELKRLTLYNCYHFPNLSARLAELQGVKCNQGFWETHNLGVLAPVSAETLKKICKITEIEIEKSIKDGENFVKQIDRINLEVPFTTQLFGKSCNRNTGIFVGQKGHMAKSDEKRNDLYVRKMWRTFCPFLKCGCERPGKNDPNACKDHITWYDHAVWYLLNCSHILWPNKSSTYRFLQLIKIMNSKAMRAGAVAFIGYLKLRETMFKMASRFAEDKYANLKQEFGNTKAAGILEKTIKARKFLMDSLEQDDEKETYHKFNSYKKRKQVIDNDFEVVMPPRFCKKAASASTGITETDISDGSHLNLDDSVNKPAKPTDRNAGIRPTTLTF